MTATGGGRGVAAGPPEAVLAPALPTTVHGVAAEVIPHPTTGTPTVVHLPGPPVEHDLSVM
ncbi:hypothetical protein ACF06X_00475 [Streptomyces sp. NPDC015346]|uniref:hypothetical protein n=1 Tax=Streptomyces sp. NPDC015346 TaxID=3364954 RepID=UPI0036FA5F9B